MDKDIKTAVHALLFFSVISIILLLLPLNSCVNAIRAVMGYTFFPFMRSGHYFSHYLANLPETFASFPYLYEENRALKEEVKRLTINQAHYGSVKAENERLSKMLNIVPNKDFSGVWANVINYDAADRYSMILVNRGTLDGVQTGQTALSVINGNAVLAGRVIEASDNTAYVLFITDISSSVTARIEDVDSNVLLTGRGDNTLALSYIPVSQEKLEGKKVYVAAASSVFPQNVLVGVIKTSLPDSQFVNYKTALVEPVLNVQSVSEVFIVTSYKRGKP